MTKSGTVHYDACPVCRSPDIHPLLTVRDHSVSGEDFVIWQCGVCTLRFTQDVPDAESIGPYYKSEDYISHSNTSKGVINRLYQRVRRFTLEGKASLVRQTAGRDQGSLLDVGCGTGAFLATMKGKGWTVDGIEPDEGARTLAARLYGIHPRATDEFAQLPSGAYHAITLWHVLEHVHDLHPYMERLQELLAPGGVLLIAVPNYESGDAAVYRSFWAAYDVPRHLYHFSPKAVQALVQQHGMRVSEQRPMWFDSFYISLLSSKYRKGRTDWIGAGFTGLRSNLSALANRAKASSIIYVIKSR